MKAKGKQRSIEEILSANLPNNNIKADWLVASAVDDIYDLFDEPVEL